MNESIVVIVRDNFYIRKNGKPFIRLKKINMYINDLLNNYYLKINKNYSTLFFNYKIKNGDILVDDKHNSIYYGVIRKTNNNKKTYKKLENIIRLKNE